MLGDSGVIQWLPFAILGLVMTVGYFVMRLMQSRQKTRPAVKPKRERQSELERELQAEIDAVQRRRARSGAGEAAVLEPPGEEKNRLEEVKRRIAAAEKVSDREE